MFRHFSSFNPKLVRLEANTRLLSNMTLTSFNPKLVRLEVQERAHREINRVLRFNPKLVRLEVFVPLPLYRLLFLFQSQTGSIRSLYFAPVVGDQHCFNPKLVRLEDRNFASIAATDSSFNPKLVRLEVVRMWISQITPSMFQSQTGSIRSPVGCLVENLTLVSIPNWFD